MKPFALALVLLCVGCAPAPPKPVAPEIINSDYGGYSYSYGRDGDTVIAMFIKKQLERDDELLIGAIGDVIRKGFGDSVISRPELVPYEEGSSVNGLRVVSKTCSYMVLPVKEDTGKINSLKITRVRCWTPS